jgi:hypothetical protein
MAPARFTLAKGDGNEAASRIDQLCLAYARAYGVEPSTQKVEAFRRRATKQFDRPGFALVTAQAGAELIGFAGW